MLGRVVMHQYNINDMSRDESLVDHIEGSGKLLFKYSP